MVMTKAIGFDLWRVSRAEAVAAVAVEAAGVVVVVVVVGRTIVVVVVVVVGAILRLFLSLTRSDGVYVGLVGVECGSEGV